MTSSNKCFENIAYIILIIMGIIVLFTIEFSKKDGICLIINGTEPIGYRIDENYKIEFIAYYDTDCEATLPNDKEEELFVYYHKSILNGELNFKTIMNYYKNNTQFPCKLETSTTNMDFYNDFRCE